MDQTQNYNLIKPTDDDFYDVQDFNDNADIIDTALKSHDTQMAQIEEDLDTHTLNNTNAHGIQNKVDKGLPTQLVLSTLAAGFTGSINYDKNDIGLVTLRLNVLKDSDYTAGGLLTLATMPVGYRPNASHSTVGITRTSGGTLVKDAYAEISIDSQGIISVRTIPSGVFTNARLLQNNTLAYTARG